MQHSLTGIVLFLQICVFHRTSFLRVLCGSWCGQAWGVLEHRAGNISRARELFQQGVWAQPRGKAVAYVWQVRSPDILSVCELSFMHQPPSSVGSRSCSSKRQRKRRVSLGGGSLAIPFLEAASKVETVGTPGCQKGRPMLLLLV